MGGNNRIILATDGDFSLSKAAIDLILEHAEAGITLSVFKFGSKPGQNLKTISDSGQGNLISITPENAEIFMIKEAQKRIWTPIFWTSNSWTSNTEHRSNRYSIEHYVALSRV